MSMSLDIAISDLIPHKGAMCLLDEIVEWNETSVVCRTRTHMKPDNPLLVDNELHIVNGVEYGAQAMAVHGGLLAKSRNQTLPLGYLAAMRNVKFNRMTLHDLPESLMVSATMMLADGGNLVYEFQLSHKQELVASGRVAVVVIGEQQ